MRQALALYRIRHKQFDRESHGASVDTADASIVDWVAGTSATAAGIGRYLRSRARRGCRCGHGRGKERGCTYSTRIQRPHEPVQTGRQDSSSKRRGATQSRSSLTIAIVPLALDYLGPERYGIWLTLSSFLALLGFMDLGLGNAVMTGALENGGR